MTIAINLLTYIFEALISLFFFGKKFEKRFHIGIILSAFALSALIQFGLNVAGIQASVIITENENFKEGRISQYYLIRL